MGELVRWGVDVRLAPDRSHTCQALECLSPPSAWLVWAQLSAGRLYADLVCRAHANLGRRVGRCLLFPLHRPPNLEVIGQAVQRRLAEQQRQMYTPTGGYVNFTFTTRW